MRYDDFRRSDDVEDRRDDSGGGVCGILGGEFCGCGVECEGEYATGVKEEKEVREGKEAKELEMGSGGCGAEDVGGLA